MAEAFAAYIKTITALTLFSVMAGLLMPEGSFRKYLEMVLGVMILSAVIQPLFHLGGALALPSAQWEEDLPGEEEYAALQEKWSHDAYEAQMEEAILMDLRAEDDTVEWVRVGWDQDPDSDTYGALESLEIGGKDTQEQIKVYAAKRYALCPAEISVSPWGEGDTDE
ncbi:stage III sporulation protein AF [Anaerotignum lactatifermentans]|uniref:Stage III sporulation protein AF n=1 Tax=Anaerotignum lactatifermentans TaxID=160404 RepID=A0ABS2G8F0_9FIRM|nr:stage III sporulation protein AF [Anaerotignum lactatifermentans]MBM6828083.1 stage III sporulation protein AF [Anaerotignum lactatifermentans]MBM6876754.1 stage III sporulation protein AF [Anaerotignum lactatifermentans]MBM6949666.1 stage III sporulation protein AF [Anaerotignum lactatifermentans]